MRRSPLTVHDGRAALDGRDGLMQSHSTGMSAREQERMTGLHYRATALKRDQPRRHMLAFMCALDTHIALSRWMNHWIEFGSDPA